MWIYFHILLTVVAVQAGKRQQVIKGVFPEGQNAATRSIFNQNSGQLQLLGNGIIRKNGRTSLKIQIEIEPARGQEGRAGAEEFPPPGVRPPGIGRRPVVGGRRPVAGRGPPGAGAGSPGAEEGPGTEAEGPEGPGAGIGGPETGEFTEEEQTGLMKHNEFRAIHGAPAMKLNRKMCDEAKEYAQKIAQMKQLKHSSSDQLAGQGENLSMGCSTNMPQAMETAVENWYNEVCDPGYDFNNGGFSGGTGHFTQVVWKESIELGMGRAETKKDEMNCAYIVGRYKPAGNMGGKFQENVLKGTFDADSYCATVRKRGLKFFDEQGRPVIVNSPISAVDDPSEKTEPSVLTGQQGKKKSIVGNKKHKQ